MSSKLTEITDSSPYVPLPSVLCGSEILSQLASPWSMASSGHFDPGQIYDGYKAVQVLDPPCTECLAKGKDFFQHFSPKTSKFHFCFVGKKPCPCPGSMASNLRRYLWSKKDGPFGKEFPVSEGPTPEATSGYSDFPISRINTAGLVKRIRRITNSPPDLDGEGSDEFDGEEVEVVNNPVGQESSTFPSQPPAKRFQSCLIPSTPRNLQPTLAAIPTSLPHSSPSSFRSRPAINTAVRSSLIQQPRASPIVTSQKLQHEASSSRRIEGLLPLLFPAAQGFQQRDCWLI
ncbi:hypothetical protein O181_050567 [Austropuccinia psidii MF-1]|uniref:Uncharacterized protein n=1 Tax=Austropuccinia psidii MF-1 TaxID=1389203 RepID=A0A9Q3HNQ2_9BASI|nr:hypothetical protein [Austropuccinia psidii MF-1]